MTSTATGTGPTGISGRERRRVLAATTIGTAIEWYDYFLYAAEVGMVSTIAFLAVAISFLSRPLGACVAGHVGDRLGRRFVLMVTLFAMGGATTLIGVLPTYETLGYWAPLLLILLRVVQGISAGGEWGSAVLLAVEHAPNEKRGMFGAGPQIGVPLGLLLSSGVLSVMDLIAPGDAFMQWGWRVPFLLSIALVAVGYFVRMGVDESPVFEEMAERKEVETENPAKVLFKRFTPLVIVAALVFAG